MVRRRAVAAAVGAAAARQSTLARCDRGAATLARVARWQPRITRSG